VQTLPVEDGSVTLMEATSVFTHLIEGQAEFYLDEVQRVLAADGRLVSTWFLFDKAGFPYMQDNQNALYINDRDPTNAVVYDRAWLGAALASRGLVMAGVYPPSVRGFHWTLHIVRDGPGVQAVEIPPDSAPAGRRAPPLLREGADRFGLDGAPVSLAGQKTPRSEPPPPSPLAIELQAAKLQIASLQAQVSALRGELEARSPRRARRAGRTRRARPPAPREEAVPATGPQAATWIAPNDEVDRGNLLGAVNVTIDHEGCTISRLLRVPSARGAQLVERVQQR